MGVFDWVFLKCPSCGIRIEEQSKAMPQPFMDIYESDRVPTEIAVDLVYEEDLGIARIICDCGARLVMKTNVPRYARLWLEAES